MTREHFICFDLGFRVDDRTEFYNRLVSLFGVGGTVSSYSSTALIPG